MDLIREEKNGRIFLKIEGAMSIYDAVVLRDELATCFEKHKGLVLDLGEVSDCDTAGVQLVCSAQVSAAAADKSFVVSGTSPAVSDAFLRTGLNIEDFQNLEKEKSNG